MCSDAPSMKRRIFEVSCPPQFQQPTSSSLLIWRRIVSETCVLQRSSRGTVLWYTCRNDCSAAGRTPAPRVSAPLSSHTAAISAVCLRVSAPLPTLVPKLRAGAATVTEGPASPQCTRGSRLRQEQDLLATSLAPIPKENTKVVTVEAAKIHVTLVMRHGGSALACHPAWRHARTTQAGQDVDLGRCCTAAGRHAAWKQTWRPDPASDNLRAHRGPDGARLGNGRPQGPHASPGHRRAGTASEPVDGGPLWRWASRPESRLPTWHRRPKGRGEAGPTVTSSRPIGLLLETIWLFVSVDFGTYMRLDLLLGSAKGCLGSTCTSLCGWKGVILLSLSL